MLKYKSKVINKLLNKLKEIKTGKFNTKIVYKAEVDEIIMRTKNSQLTLYEVMALNKGPIEIWNAEQKIYSGHGNFLKVNLIDNTKDVIIKGDIARLNCFNNKLSTLDLTKSTSLSYLDCNDNLLSILNLDKSISLSHLYCNSNQLYTLNLDKNINLEYLNCSNNQLSALNVDKNINLRYLNCKYDQLILNSIVQILESIGKIKTNDGNCHLSNNSHTDFTQPQELVEALNTARANGWTIYTN